MILFTAVVQVNLPFSGLMPVAMFLTPFFEIRELLITTRMRRLLGKDWCQLKSSSTLTHLWMRIFSSSLSELFLCLRRANSTLCCALFFCCYPGSMDLQRQVQFNLLFLLIAEAYIFNSI